MTDNHRACYACGHLAACHYEDNGACEVFGCHCDAFMLIDEDNDDA